MQAAASNYPAPVSRTSGSFGSGSSGGSRFNQPAPPVKAAAMPPPAPVTNNYNRGALTCLPLQTPCADLSICTHDKIALQFGSLPIHWPSYFDPSSHLHVPHLFRWNDEKLHGSARAGHVMNASFVTRCSCCPEPVVKHALTNGATAQPVAPSPHYMPIWSTSGAFSGVDNAEDEGRRQALQRIHDQFYLPMWE